MPERTDAQLVEMLLLSMNNSVTEHGLTLPFDKRLGLCTELSDGRKLSVMVRMWPEGSQPTAD
jgi:hypothetical protein